MRIEDGWYRLRKNAQSEDVTIVLVIFGRVIHAHQTSWGAGAGPYRFLPGPTPTFILSEPPGPELDDWLWEKLPLPGEVVEAQGCGGDPPIIVRYSNFIVWFIVGVLVSALAAVQLIGR